MKNIRRASECFDDSLNITPTMYQDGTLDIYIDYNPDYDAEIEIDRTKLGGSALKFLIRIIKQNLEFSNRIYADSFHFTANRIMVTANNPRVSLGLQIPLTAQFGNKYPVWVHAGKHVYVSLPTVVFESFYGEKYIRSEK